MKSKKGKAAECCEHLGTRAGHVQSVRPRWAGGTLTLVDFSVQWHPG